MGLKCYTTKVPAHQSISEIQEMLVKRRVTGFMYQYEVPSNGRVESLSFAIVVGSNNETISFRLPLRWKLVQETMSKDGTIPQSYRLRARTDDDYAYRVAWRILREWVDAQCAVIDVKMTRIQEVFLPYAVTPDGTTLFDKIARDPKMLLLK